MVVEVSLFDVCACVNNTKRKKEKELKCFFQSQLVVRMFNPACFSAQCPFFFDKHVCSGIIAWRPIISSDVMFSRTSAHEICTGVQAKSRHLFVCVFVKLILCIVASRRLRMSLPLPSPFEAEVIKSSMGATSCFPPTL